MRGTSLPNSMDFSSGPAKTLARGGLAHNNGDPEALAD